MVVILATGGDDAPPEMAGDLTYLEGKALQEAKGNLVASIADVTRAEVRRDLEAVVFSARTAATVPQPLKISALQFRWDIEPDAGPTWTITATVEKTTEATVYSSAGFGVGTIDQTLPGTVTVDEDTIEVRVDVKEIPHFPNEFDWSLTTTLRAFREAPDSPRVEDRYPDDGTERFEN